MEKIIKFNKNQINEEIYVHNIHRFMYSIAQYIRKEDYYYIEDDDEWVLIYDLFFIVL